MPHEISKDFVNTVVSRFGTMWMPRVHFNETERRVFYTRVKGKL